MLTFDQLLLPAATECLRAVKYPDGEPRDQPLNDGNEACQTLGNLCALAMYEADAAAWVRSLGFAEHAGAFSEAGVDGKRLLGLTAEALEAELLLPVAEHRLALEMEIAELKLRRGLLSRADKKAHLAAFPRAAGRSYRARALQSRARPSPGPSRS